MIETPTVLENLPRPPTLTKDILPYVAWRPLIQLETDDERARSLILPVIAVAWGNILNLYDVTNDITFDLKRNIELPRAVIGIAWVSHRVLVVLDEAWNLLIIDPDAEEYLVETSILKESLIANHAVFAAKPKDERAQMQSLLEGMDKDDFNKPMKSYHNFLAAHNGVIYLLVRLDTFNNMRIG